MSEWKISGFTLVPFCGDDAYEIAIHPDMGIYKNEFFDAWVQVRCCGGGWTAYKEDVGILWCGGITPVWYGVGNAWFIRSTWVENFPIATVKMCKAVLERLIDEEHYHRVQCEVRKSSTTDIRFALFLGFTVEGIMRKWGADGSDYLLMSRVQ
jgi:hypothetical protein